MKNILNPNIRCTDPDTLQFCLPLSGDKFWYCEPNGFNDRLLPCSGSTESLIFQKYMGNPQKFLEDAGKDAALKAIILNRKLWLSGEIDVGNFLEEEKQEMLSSIGYFLNDFDNDADRNQIIAEVYFESYPMDFRNDI
ncbi:hypothetical protein [Viscerimonas tarda]